MILRERRGGILGGGGGSARQPSRVSESGWVEDGHAEKGMDPTALAGRLDADIATIPPPGPNKDSDPGERSGWEGVLEPGTTAQTADGILGEKDLESNGLRLLRSISPARRSRSRAPDDEGRDRDRREAQVLRPWGRPAKRRFSSTPLSRRRSRPDERLRPGLWCA